MRQLKKCLVCGSANQRLVFESTYVGGIDEAHHFFLSGREASAHGAIRKCTGCGFVFTNPQFESAEYDAIYSRIGSGLTKSGSSGPGERANVRRFSRLHRAISEGSAFDQPFLDFGCGDAAFLRVAAESGEISSGSGFEIGAPSRLLGPGRSTIFGGHWPDLAGTLAIPWESQAFVTAFDVFEHLPDLERDVALIRRVIRPNGLLYITVPNVSSLMSRVTGKYWNMLLLEHLWYFNTQTLDAFLAKHGFEPSFHRAVPYDASVEHAVMRASQILGVNLPRLPVWLRDAVIPVPAGVLFAAYRLR